MKTLGERLRFARTKSDWTQVQLGQVAKLNPMHISHLESGRRLPSIPNAIKLCVALNCSMDWLTRGIRRDNE